MNQSTIQILTPVINVAIVAILGAIGGVLTKTVVKVYPLVNSFLESKIGAENAKKVKSFGIDMFYKIEEDGRLGKLANTKIATFETALKAQFPLITDSEIDIVRQAIAGEFNKDKKVVEEDLEPQPIVAKKIETYIAPDGTELVPKVTVSATVITTTSTDSATPIATPTV
jgi:hypothetical protein